MDKKILKLELDIKNDNNSKKFTIKEIKKQEIFNFSLMDETYANLDLFIDYLLKNIVIFDLLEIEIKDYENLESIDRELCESFKNIWETEFNEIKKDLKNFSGDSND